MSNDQDLPPEEEGAAPEDGLPEGKDQSASPEDFDDGEFGIEPEAESTNIDLQELDKGTAGAPEAEAEDRTAGDLDAVFDVPVNVSAVLGKAYLHVSQLLKLAPGAVLELDRKVGEAIDIYVNNRLVARGEVVMVEERLGITMTEIIKGEGK